MRSGRDVQVRNRLAPVKPSGHTIRKKASTCARNTSGSSGSGYSPNSIGNGNGLLTTSASPVLAVDQRVWNGHRCPRTLDREKAHWLALLALRHAGWAVISSGRVVGGARTTVASRESV
jgi:hypothetical protein